MRRPAAGHRDSVKWARDYNKGLRGPNVTQVAALSWRERPLLPARAAARGSRAGARQLRPRSRGAVAIGHVEMRRTRARDRAGAGNTAARPPRTASRSASTRSSAESLTPRSSTAWFSRVVPVDLQGSRPPRVPSRRIREHGWRAPRRPSAAALPTTGRGTRRRCARAGRSAAACAGAGAARAEPPAGRRTAPRGAGHRGSADRRH